MVYGFTAVIFTGYSWMDFMVSGRGCFAYAGGLRASDQASILWSHISHNNSYAAAASRGDNMNGRMAIGCCLFVAAGCAAAQTFPTKAVRIIVPYPAGGTSDILSRLL